jgi:hypothetical protein
LTVTFAGRLTTPSILPIRAGAVSVPRVESVIIAFVADADEGTDAAAGGGAEPPLLPPQPEIVSNPNSMIRNPGMGTRFIVNYPRYGILSLFDRSFQDNSEELHITILTVVMERMSGRLIIKYHVVKYRNFQTSPFWPMK